MPCGQDDHTVGGEEHVGEDMVRITRQVGTGDLQTLDRHSWQRGTRHIAGPSAAIRIAPHLGAPAPGWGARR